MVSPTLDLFANSASPSPLKCFFYSSDAGRSSQQAAVLKVRPGETSFRSVVQIACSSGCQERAASRSHTAKVIIFYLAV